MKVLTPDVVTQIERKVSYLRDAFEKKVTLLATFYQRFAVYISASKLTNAAANFSLTAFK